MDGAILIHELIHSLSANKDKGLLIKLDMKKAFDKVHRSFLLGTLEKLGFGHAWI